LRIRLMVIGSVLVVAAAVAAASERAATYGALNLYTEVVSLVHEQYVEPLSWDRLARLGVRGLVRGLDADSEVLTPQQYRERTAAADRTEGSIGVEITSRHHAIVVITAIDGMPAAEAGVKPGDEILKIDGTDTSGMEPLDAGERLGGVPGTTVVLSVQRMGWTEPRSMTVTRTGDLADTVTERDLGSHMLYVRIRSLEERTGEELNRLVTGAAAKEAKGVILDLRDSPGRSAEAAVQIAGMFLEPGSVVARIESRLPGQPGPLRTSAVTAFPPVPIAVLVNRGTVSAAEILAGALRESGRAVTVGTTTFGDTSAQSLIPLSDGSGLSLTTVRYLTPKGRAIEGKGIHPDFVVDMPPDHPSGAGSTSAAVTGSDPQLELALEITKAASIMDLRQDGAAGHAAATPAGKASGTRASARRERSVAHSGRAITGGRPNA
jgi:carboxyl-terminal processing protease